MLKFRLISTAMFAAGMSLPLSAVALDRFPLPVGYWSFDKCDQPGMDDAAHAVHAQAYEQAACVPSGLFGSAASFDGVGDRFEAPDHTAFTLQDQMTVSAWIQPWGTYGSQAIVNQWYGMDSWLLALDSGDALFAVAFPDGGWGQPVVARSPLPPTDDGWYHVAGVYTGTEVQLYINGLLVDTKSPPPVSSTIQDTGVNIGIGNNPWDGDTGSSGMQGLIDEVKLFNTALTGAQLESLAARPGVSTRGIHLNMDPWIDPDQGVKYLRDLDILQTIGNVNSVKAAIFTYPANSRAGWLDLQNRKLRELKAAVGNHATFLLRAWPVSDFGDLDGADWYERGYNFAVNLSPTLAYATNDLGLQHLFVEVGNEPNFVEEPFFHVIDGMTNYNDFFHGFYEGLAEEELDVPLVYAGLSPGALTQSADNWYRNSGVRSTILNYADRVGVHTYWDDRGEYTHREDETNGGGRNYRTYRHILTYEEGLEPSLGNIPIFITEFDAVRQSYPGSSEDDMLDLQVADYCEWWQIQSQEAAAYGVEQAFVYLTSWGNDDQDGGHHALYSLGDRQLDDIRDCR